MTTLQQIEQAKCPGYTSPFTGTHYPATNHVLTTRRGVRCASCGVPEPILRAEVEAGTR